MAMVLTSARFAGSIDTPRRCGYTYPCSSARVIPDEVGQLVSPPEWVGAGVGATRPDVKYLPPSGHLSPALLSRQIPLAGNLVGGSL